MKNFGEYVIKLNTMKSNAKIYKEKIGDKKICAVVKADAYGIGIENVVPQIESFVDAFAVANFDEAKKAQKYSNKQIFILNFVPLQNLGECQNCNFCISVSSFQELKSIVCVLKKNKTSCGMQQKISFAINTGMNRLGFSDVAEFERCLRYAKKNKKYILPISIFSHIYNSQSKRLSTIQNCIFMQYLKVFKKHFDISKIAIHLLASEASLRYPNFAYDMTRPGILLYCNFDGKSIFEDTIEVHSKIVAINKVMAGKSVGYGQNFIAKKNMVVATIPIGYADGIFRSYSKNGKLLCHGKFCKIVGNICMDMLMIDISNVADAKLFDKVTLVGKNGKKEISIFQMSRWCGTIPYEILTSLKKTRFDILFK